MNASSRSGEDGRLDRKTKMRRVGAGRRAGGFGGLAREDGSRMFARKKTEGRKEGRNIARQERRHSECNPRADCFQILMSRDLLYQRRVGWSERGSSATSSGADVEAADASQPTNHPSRHRRAIVKQLVDKACASRRGGPALSGLDHEIFRNA